MPRTFKIHVCHGHFWEFHPVLFAQCPWWLRFKQSFHIFMVTSWVNNWWGSDQSPWIRAISCCHAMPLFPWVAAAAWFEDIAEEAAAQFSSAEAGGICLNGERRVQFVQKTLQHRLKVYGMKWHLRNSGSSFVSCSFLHVLLTSVGFWSKSFLVIWVSEIGQNFYGFPPFWTTGCHRRCRRAPGSGRVDLEAQHPNGQGPL